MAHGRAYVGRKTASQDHHCRYLWRCAWLRKITHVPVELPMACHRAGDSKYLEGRQAEGNRRYMRAILLVMLGSDPRQMQGRGRPGVEFRLHLHPNY